jgi:phosphoserine aminotransferase
MKKPSCVNFSSGPCSKHSSWKIPLCKFAGRSHRSVDGLKLIQKIIRLQKKVLNIPDDYFVGIVAGSSTGAMETLLWSLVGANGVDILAHCVFSQHWANDVVNELKVKDVNLITADFPHMSDVSKIDADRDLIFCMSSTTSGISFYNLDWISSNRKGLTFCDAASAAFVVDFDWHKLDAVAFSWQKGLGGEAGTGTIVLSPRAIERLESYSPDRPIPRIFRIAKNKKVNFAIFNGFTINTPSMICLEDFYENLLWADRLGGIKALAQRVEKNYETVQKWVDQQNVFRFLVDEKFRAHHITCLDIVSEKYHEMPEDQQWSFLKKIIAYCEKEGSGFDFLGHILTKPHLRIWTGPTIDHEDLKKFLPWIEYAYDNL